jgi:hypothetical protein
MLPTRYVEREKGILVAITPRLSPITCIYMKLVGAYEAGAVQSDAREQISDDR